MILIEKLGVRAECEALHWRYRYEWRRCEAMLNDWGQYKTAIDGLDIHSLASGGRLNGTVHYVPNAANPKFRGRIPYGGMWGALMRSVVPAELRVR